MDSVSDFESGGCGFGVFNARNFPSTCYDVFVIQATTNTLCAHFISLLSTSSLLARSVKHTKITRIIQIGRVVGRLRKSAAPSRRGQRPPSSSSL